MTYLIQKFSRLAIRETDFPDRAYGVADEAAACCIGAIGQAAMGRVFYDYALLVTNTNDEILSPGQLNRDRADAENAFDELKNQWGWGG